MCRVREGGRPNRMNKCVCMSENKINMRKQADAADSPPTQLHGVCPGYSTSSHCAPRAVVGNTVPRIAVVSRILTRTSRPSWVAAGVLCNWPLELTGACVGVGNEAVAVGGMGATVDRVVAARASRRSTHVALTHTRKNTRILSFYFYFKAWWFASLSPMHQAQRLGDCWFMHNMWGSCCHRGTRAGGKVRYGES